MLQLQNKSTQIINSLKILLITISMQFAQYLNNQGHHELARQILIKSSIPFTDLRVQPVQAMNKDAVLTLKILKSDQKTDLNHGSFEQLQQYFPILQSYTQPILHYVTDVGYIYLVYDVNGKTSVYRINHVTNNTEINRAFLIGRMLSYEVFSENDILVMFSDSYELCVINMIDTNQIVRKQFKILSTEPTYVDVQQIFIHKKQQISNSNSLLDTINVSFVGADRVLYKLEQGFFKHALNDVLGIVILKGAQAVGIVKSGILLINFQVNNYTQLLAIPQGIEIIAFSTSLKKTYYYVMLSNQSLHLYKLGEKQFKASHQLQSLNTQIEIIDDDNFVVKVGEEIISFQNA